MNPLIAAKLINSTIGTRKYQSLDELIEQSMYLQTTTKPSDGDWKAIQDVVQKGIARFYYPIGTQFDVGVKYTDNSEFTYKFEVVGHDNLPSNSSHSMTLLSQAINSSIPAFQNQAFAKNINLSQNTSYYFEYSGKNYTFTATSGINNVFLRIKDPIQKTPLEENQVEIITQVGAIVNTLDISVGSNGSRIGRIYDDAADVLNISSKCLYGCPGYAGSVTRRYLCNEKRMSSIISITDKDDFEIYDYSDTFAKGSFFESIIDENLKNAIIPTQQYCEDASGNVIKLNDKITIPADYELGVGDVSGNVLDKFFNAEPEQRIRTLEGGSSVNYRLRGSAIYNDKIPCIDDNGELAQLQYDDLIKPAIMFTIG